jgi:hypothetical protein
MGLIRAAPNTFALITQTISEDHITQDWYLQAVVACVSEDAGAYIVGGVNKSGVLKRLDMVAADREFTIAGVWEQDHGGKDAAKEWATRHIETLYEDALPFERDDPRRSDLARGAGDSNSSVHSAAASHGRPPNRARPERRLSDTRCTRVEVIDNAAPPETLRLTSDVTVDPGNLSEAMPKPVREDLSEVPPLDVAARLRDESSVGSGRIKH